MSSRRSHLVLVALILVALAGVVALGVQGSPIHKSVRKGLDLQGGLEVVLKAVPPKGHALTPDDLNRSVDILRNRIDPNGVKEPEIRKQGTDQIVIELAGATSDLSKNLKPAKLELYDLEPALLAPSVDTNGNPQPSSSLLGLLSRVQSGQTGTPSAYYLFGPKTSAKSAGGTKNAKAAGIGYRLAGVRTSAAKAKPKKPATKKPAATTPAKPQLVLLAGPATRLRGDRKTRETGVLDAFGGKLPAGAQVLTAPASTQVVTCSSTSAVVCPGPQGPVQPVAGATLYYLFKHGPYPEDRNGPYPEVSGKDLKLSGTRQDFDPSSGEPVVTMQFNKHGNKAFKRVTAQEATRGSIKNADQHFAIVLDNEIRSFPSVSFQRFPQGIDPTGGGAQITGMASVSEAKTLANVLKYGALPVNFTQLERSDVSATLGKDSLKQARNAAIGGLLAVAIFLLLLYRFLGLVAVIGLGIYAAFMYAAILLFGVTLTLPGFAGLILTIGVAADANVVVFERIKEESRAGKSVRAAIAAGYAKGFRTIIDANVVTMITALVLFAVATAGVKGFALMLLIGTLVSLVTAVAATRAMLGLLAGFRWFDNPRLMGASGEQGLKFLQIDFMRRRYLWFAISGAIVLISAVSLGTKGLNLGIDFKGGVQVTFKTAAPTELTKVRAQTADIGRKDAVVQGRGKLSGSESYKEFQIRLKKLGTRDQATLSSDLTNRLDARNLGIKNVSSSFGRQIAKSAILAILFSLLVITLYITIRFKGLAYAVPVIAAMLHDVLITVGVYSVTGREVTAATVAAVLTVLGYSIYDTIIIFDRVRENVPIMRRASFATIANVSLWETIRRSLATTFITLLPVGALFFFGGATLKDFAFALLVGVTSGAYSSIFIAAPLLTIWKEREPEFARRKDSTVIEHSAQERVLAQAELAAAEEPTPATPIDVVEDGLEALTDGNGDGDGDAAKRERRRQRRKTRPHGRAR